MKPKASDSDLVRRLLTDELPQREERAAVERLIKENPNTAASLLTSYVEQKHRYKAGMEELRKTLQEAPWHPATFIRFLPDTDERSLVAVQGRRLAVAIAPDVNPDELRCGAEIFLNQDTNVLVALAADMPRSGLVGVFSRFQGDRAVLKGAADEELLVEVAEDARAAKLAAGDLLLYEKDSLVAFERVDKQSEDSYLLQSKPTVTFNDIGGLDSIIEEITGELNLHLFHPEVAISHHVRPLKGVVLTGPPGVGKTMVAEALANFVSDQHGAEAMFLNVKPGAHRSMWYGKTEENIRELFAAARKGSESGRYVVMFFDDVDQLGSRGDGANAIDQRVLPCFLQEIDGVDGELDRVLILGATNRPDLLDEALLRPGRFGDRVFRIPRPNRDAAREIFRKYLVPDLPYHNENGAGGGELAAEMTETALALLYSANGENSTLATLTFRDGSREPVTAHQVMSGALINNVVTTAKRRSCFRALRSEPVGVTMADLQTGIGLELKSIAQRLKPGPALQQMLDLPSDLDVVKVDVDPSCSGPTSYEYVRSGERTE